MNIVEHVSLLHAGEETFILNQLFHLFTFGELFVIFQLIHKKWLNRLGSGGYTEKPCTFSGLGLSFFSFGAAEVNPKVMDMLDKHSSTQLQS